jgi:hypothetical protein
MIDTSALTKTRSGRPQRRCGHMRIRLISDQFSFVDGYIDTLAGGPPDPERLDEWAVSASPLRDGVADIANVRPGPIALILRDCLVVSHAPSMERRLPSFVLTTEITANQARQDIVDVHVGPHAFARIALGHTVPVGEPPVVGIVLDDATLEAPVNREGYVDVLLPAGDRLVYLHHRPAVRTSFTVLPNQRDAGTVTLTIEPPRRDAE